MKQQLVSIRYPNNDIPCSHMIHVYEMSCRNCGERVIRHKRFPSTLCFSCKKLANKKSKLSLKKKIMDEDEIVEGEDIDEKLPPKEDEEEIEE